MAVIDNRFVCDLSKPLQAQALKGNVFSLDNLGSRISVLVYNNGQPATISGSITANCILPDGSTVNVNGTLTTENGGSLAYVDVPQSCLLIPGILKIAVKCTSSSVITTLAAIVANVYMTKTDNVITPSQQIITDWNAEISASLANQDAEIADLKSAFSIQMDGSAVDYVSGSSQWESGAISQTDGSKVTSTTRIRNSIAFDGAEYIGFSINNGYEASVNAWDANGYVGTLKSDGTFSTGTTNMVWVTGYSFKNYPQYRYRLTMRNKTSPSSSISASAGENCTFYRNNMSDFEVMSNAYTDITPVDLTSTTYVYTCRIGSSDEWYTGGTPSPKCFILPIPDNANRIKIKAASDANASIAFLTSNSHTPNQNVSYVSGTGKLSVAQGITQTLIIPADAKYLYILKSTSTTYTPESASFLSYQEIPFDEIESIENLVSSYEYTWIMPSSGNYVSNRAYHFDKDVQYLIYWESAYSLDSANLYTRVTSSGENADTIAENVKPYVYVNFTPTVDAEYIRIVATGAGTIHILKDGTFPYEINGLNSRVTKLEKGVVPFVKFEYDHTMYDPATELASMDYTSKSTVIEQVYALFDALVTNYSGYVSRYDAVELLDLTYPTYANGIDTPYTETHIIDYDGETPITKEITFGVTPAYKTYMYKFSGGSTALAANKKKKMLIICGVHGNEVAAPFNAYLLAKRLCGAVDNADIEKLRASYNIYIVPYLNGYGCYHQTRCNANRIDINRNFPTSGWTFGGVSTIDSDGSCVYTGLEPGNEFETKIVMGLYNHIKPNVFIDHHNSGTGSSQFYTVVTNTLCANVVYQSLTDCSFAFIKNLSSYFGTAYNLFAGSDVSPGTLTGTAGNTDRWAYEQGCITSGTIEIFECINYQNGSVSPRTKYTADAFSVGEYTLRNMVLHLCDFEMNRN